jgi:ribonuclease HIII
LGIVVLNYNLTKIIEMKNYYNAYLIDKKPIGSVFAAKTPACMITAYKSGKVLFQGNDSDKEAIKRSGASWYWPYVRHWFR